MQPDDPYVKTYRPWTMVVLAGIGLGVDIVFIARLVAMALGSGHWDSVRLALPAVLVGGLMGWVMSNRLKLASDRLDSRYLWQSRIIRRDEIDHVHDIRPLGSATSFALVLKDGRVVALTWSGEATVALGAWLSDVPRRADGADS